MSDAARAQAVAADIVRELWLNVPRNKESWDSAIASVTAQVMAYAAGPTRTDNDDWDELIAQAIERAHAPQSVGSHARALWIARAVRPILDAFADEQTAAEAAKHADCCVDRQEMAQMTARAERAEALVARLLAGYPLA